LIFMFFFNTWVGGCYWSISLFVLLIPGWDSLYKLYQLKAKYEEYFYVSMSNLYTNVRETFRDLFHHSSSHMSWRLLLINFIVRVTNSQLRFVI
jgi:hypothetical protein